MSQVPPEGGASTLEESAETYCYLHPDTPTRLKCSRCERPICGRCAIPASVGQHCPYCVAEARKAQPKVRSAMAKQSPVVLGIIVVTVGFYIAQQILGDCFTLRLASSPGAGAAFCENIGPSVADGGWWRLVTPVLVHASTIHILLNMLVLYVYGPNVEQAFGSLRFLLLYLLCGLSGSAFSYAFGGGGPSVGASGAIFGIVGVLLVFLYNRRSQQFVRQYLRGIMIFLGLNLVLGFAIPNVDVMAHLGGLVAGVILALGFDRQGGPEARSNPALQLAATLVILGGSALLVLMESSGTLPT
jgi:membrane associated rhomboid family serine protease